MHQPPGNVCSVYTQFDWLLLPESKRSKKGKGTEKYPHNINILVLPSEPLDFDIPEPSLISVIL
jgi:hypothetical protein